ncbi:MAG: hypothetical protein RLZZ601_2137 [Pseudomonadota bacterium]|jgi:hypothetical protein
MGFSLLLLTTPTGMSGLLSAGMSGRFGLESVTGLTGIHTLVVGPQTALLAELFPAKTRNSAATLPHNLAAGWIGGLLPLIVTWLNQFWESNIAGLWYPTILLAGGAVVALLYLPETKKANLRI